MKRLTIFCWVLISLTSLILPVYASPIPGINFNGDVDPANPSNWTSSTDGYIGKTADGSVEMFGGFKLYSAFGYLGHDAGVSGNMTIDSGATWTNQNDLFVGYSGTGTIDIINGGILNSTNALVSVDFLGYQPGSSGTININGIGSRWNNGESWVGLCFGYSGNGTLRITDGGTATSNGLQCLLGYTVGSKGEIMVDGPNSTWANNCSNTVIGDAGNGTLNIINGGTVNNTSSTINSNTYLGKQIGSIGTINVDGTGSTWTSSIKICVGTKGSGVLNITNGAIVTSESRNYIGMESGATGMANVSGDGSTWTCNDLRVGYNGTGTLTITGGATVTSVEGPSHPYAIMVGQNAGSMGMVTVDGTNSTWTNDGFLCIGNEGTGILNITHGGTVSATKSHIGIVATSHATISGEGSSLTNTGEFHISNGTLDISDGGSLTSYDSGYVGGSKDSSATVTIKGSGSIWTNHGYLYVGNRSDGSLSVTSGATLISERSTIARYSDSTGIVSIEGINATWTNEELYVGYQGNGTLNITKGGTVTVEESTWVAYEADATGAIHFGTSTKGGTLNTLTLHASSSQLNGTGTINAVGLVGDLELVFDANHGITQAITLNDHTDQNVTINLDLSNTSGKLGDLGVGYRESGTMAIQDGVWVESKDGYLGYFANSTGVVTVDGSGSTWKISDLNVGRKGNGTIHITNGGTVVGHDIDIGYATDSAGLVTVSGTNSSLQSSYLSVGCNGEGTLLVTDGSAVDRTSMGGGLSCSVGARGILIVDGAGSTLTAINLNVHSHHNGGFQVINGAVVNSSTTYISHSPSGTNMSAAKVEGNHSIWLTDWLYVGYRNNSIGTLSISDRGTVNTRVSSTIGRESQSIGIVTVDGIGSAWNNSQNLIVGDDGAGELNILNGGLASVAGTLIIDTDDDNDSFVNMSTGGMLALYGDADDSLGQFLDLVDGTDAIRYWDSTINDWELLTNASGDDYLLEYMAGGDLAGYTVLTVGAVPEPGCVIMLLTLLATGLIPAFLRRTR